MAAIATVMEAAEIVEDIGYFFVYKGGIQFASSDGKQKENSASGHARVLQTAPKFGLTVYSDLTGAQDLHPATFPCHDRLRPPCD